MIAPLTTADILALIDQAEAEVIRLRAIIAAAMDSNHVRIAVDAERERCLEIVQRAEIEADGPLGMASAGRISREIREGAEA